MPKPRFAVNSRELSRLIQGIYPDPGVTGAIAVLSEEGELVSVADTPVIEVKNSRNKIRTVYVESDMASVIGHIQDSGTIRLLAIENVHSMKDQGVASMFSMGIGFGIWLGILAALQVPYDRIDPVKWKREMGIPAGSDKGVSVVHAARLFPAAGLKHKTHHGRADALLIAEHIRRRIRMENKAA